MLSRRDFICMTGALMVCGPFMGKAQAAIGLPKYIVLSARIKNKLHFVKMDSVTKKITKIEANCGPHSYYEDNGIFYATEKKGRYLGVIDFNNPQKLKKITAPDGIIFYGHCATYKDKLIVSAVRIGSTKTDYDIQQSNPNEAHGVLLVYNKFTLNLIGHVENFGYGPHEITFHKGAMYVAVCKNYKHRSSVIKINPDTLKVIQEFQIADEYSYLWFRHFIRTDDEIYTVLGCYEGQLATNVAIGIFNKDGTIKISDYSNAKNKGLDYDHTTSFAYKNKLYVVLYNINKILVFDKRTGSFLDLKQGDYDQLKTISEMCLDGKNEFIFNDPDFMPDKFLIKSHIYIPDVT